MIEIEQDLLLIEILYTDLYNAYHKLKSFDQNVYNWINQKYGINTLESLQRIVLYNKEIDNVVLHNITNNNVYNKVAQKHSEYQQIYIQEISKLRKNIGHSEVNKILDILQTLQIN